MPETLGPYELRSEIGRGAMAVIWQAWDPVRERDVAIKELLLPAGVDPAMAAEYAARFLREGQAATALSHPGIVSVYAAEIHEGRLALVMELFEGETLGQRISRGPVDPPTALTILERLLEALAYTHSEGVIHGGIEPDNIFLTSTGQAKLAGFGIPYVGGDLALTRAGVVMGTPGYLAPEQIAGELVDTRADLFALGAVAYEMLGGKNPFGASDGLPASTVMYRTAYQAAPGIPHTALAGLPRDVRPALDVALAKEPESRFPDAESFLAALRGTAPVADTVAPTKLSPVLALSSRSSGPQRKWLPYALLGALAVVALVVVLVVTQGGHSGLSSETTVALRNGTSTGPPSTLVIVTTTTVAGVSSTVTTTASTIATTTTTAITTTTTTTPTRYQQSDSHLAYLGSWSTSAASEASGGSFRFSNAGGASVTVTFDGTYLAWIAKESPAYGVAKLTLDNKAPVTVDLYSASTLWQQKVWNTGTLPSGTHTVKIEWTGTKNAAATDANISLDAFDVIGALQ